MATRRAVRLALTSLPCWALLVGVAFGQGPASSAGAEPPAVLLDHRSILGATVTRNDSPAVVARIVDLTINARSGRLCSAVLALPETERGVVVPWKLLSYVPDREGFSIALSAADLGRMPTAQRPAPRSRPALRAGVGGRPADGSGLLHASELSRWQVVAGDQVIGAPSALVIAPAAAEAAFAVVAVPPRLVGKTSLTTRCCVLPWNALRAPGNNGRSELRLQTMARSLVLAPRLSEASDLGKAAFRKRVYDFFRVEPQDFERRERRG